MAYSEVGDLLLGDMEINPLLDQQKFVDGAAEEMDAKLGWVYALPLRGPGVDPATETSWLDLPTHQVLLLKQINNKLASGRLILTLAIASEGSTLHAYGWQLIREANAELLLLSNGTVDLDAEPLDPVVASGDPLMPAVFNHDEESLFAGFENTVMRGKPWYSRPGKVT